MKNLLKSLHVVASVLVAMFVSAFLSAMTGIRVGYFVAGLLILGTVGRSQAGVLTLNVSPNVAGIANYLGMVRPTLFGTLYNNFDIANDITLVPGVKSTMRLTKLLINNGAEPYSGIFEPNNNDIAYSEQDLVVSQWQRDMLIDPRKYVGTYLEYFRAAGEGALNKTIPFAQYTVAQFLKQIASSMNTTSAFFGLGSAAFAAYNPATAYAVGAKIKYVPAGNTKLQYYICNAVTVAGQSPDTTPGSWTKRNDLALCVGLGTQIINDRAAGKITNVVATGAITAGSGAYNQVKAVFRSLPDPVKQLGVNVYMARGVYELLIDDIQNLVGKYTETDESGIVYLYNTERKCVLKPTTWQYGSQLIIATPKENLLMGTDLLSDMNEMNIIQDVYTIKFGLTGVIGFNYQDAAVMAINDQN